MEQTSLAIVLLLFAILWMVAGTFDHNQEEESDGAHR
jgi:hypothetical protein